MKKIALFIDTFYPMIDGVVACVDNYAKRLKADGFEVVVFAPRDRDKKYVDDFSYQVQRCKSVKVFFLDYDLPLPALDRQFKKAMKNMHFDLFHIHSPFTVGSCAIKYAKKHNIPSVATFHSQYKLDFKRALKFDCFANLAVKKIIKVFNRATLCLTMNEFTRDLLKEYGCKNKIQLLPNGTEMKLEGSIEQYKEIANKRFNLEHVKFMMLYVGRINNLKNLPLIIDTLALLPQEANFKMVFVGDGQDKSELESRVKKLGIEDKVLFTGKILDRELLQTLYARTDLFLIPSTYDTDAIVKIEAACFEKPSIAIAGTGAGAAITDNVNGFLFNGEKQEFANLLEKLYNNPQHVKKVGRQAKADLYITWDQVVKKLEGIYLDLIENFGEKK